MNNYVAVFTIGPVQSFIASARKTEDLWSGSYLLSHIIEQVIKKIETDKQATLIFPQIEQAQSIKEVSDVAAYPNRITFTYEGEKTNIATLLKELEKTAQHTLQELGEKAVVRSFNEQQRANILPIATSQLNNFLEIYWSAKPYGQSSFYDAKTEAEKEIGALKNNKQFKQDTTYGLACTVCNERTALLDVPIEDNDKIGAIRSKYRAIWKGTQKKNEFLCSICLTKREMRRMMQNDNKLGSSFIPFASTLDIEPKELTYFAILQMDGDNMGTYFTGDDPDKYSEVSERLAVFSKEKVPKIIKKHKGMLVYSGGDDVLAFLPVNRVLDAAYELRREFASEQVLGKDATISGGIMVAHKEHPLHFLLRDVRELEDKAKSYRYEENGVVYEKDALAICVKTRGGETSTSVIPWHVQDIHSTEVLSDLKSCFEAELSKRFIYQFNETFSPLVIDDQTYIDARLVKTEFTRIMNRSTLKKDNKLSFTKEKIDQLFSLYERQRSLQHFMQLMKMLTFFYRQEKKGSGT